MNYHVVDYLKSERQWTRQCRIEHARLMLAYWANTTEQNRFWHEVIFRLTGSEK